MTRTLLVFCVVALAACDDDTTTPAETMDLSAPATSDLGVARSADVPLAFQPAGLWWDATTQSLYLANDGGQQLVRWREDLHSFVVATNLPQIAPSSGGLGQLIEAKDGSWLVPRFGFGMAGAILQVDKSNAVSSIAGLMTMRQRVGLTQAADGSVYTSWYLTVNKLPQMGSVSRVALDGSGESDVVTGLSKPVAVLALGDQLYVSDELAGVVSKTPLTAPGTTTTFATIAGAGALAAGPGGVIFAVTSTGDVWSIDAGGAATNVKSGYKPLRGVAYDGEHKRLFVAEPDKGNPDGGAAMPMLHVLPIE